MVNQCGVDEGLRKIELFAGAGGGILASNMLGIRTVCAVEQDPYAAAILLDRQNDGTFQPCPIWDDVQTFDGKPWRGLVDVVAGGFPCTNISSAGKGEGIEGEASGLWSHMLRIICEIRPRYAFAENSPMLTVRGLDRVLCDLAALGYDVKWCVISAANIGANHERARIWIKAELPDSNMSLGEGGGLSKRSIEKFTEPHSFGAWWEYDPAESDKSRMGRMASGIPNWTHRVKCLGNAQVPLCAATAWRILGD